MAANPPPSSSSSRRTRTGDRVVGSFSIDDEIGKGSFATVYRGNHKVCSLKIVVETSLGHNSFLEDVCQSFEHIRANHDVCRPLELL